MTRPPQFDENGLNIFDPEDRRGDKSSYITLLQEKALRNHLPEGNGGLAIDVGSGYGRMLPILESRGWMTIGIDPSMALLRYSRSESASARLVAGQLPDLPIAPGAAGLLLLHNVLRPLMLMDRLDVVKGVGKFVGKGGSAIVVDNVRDGHRSYLPEHELISMVENEGFRLQSRCPIRASRWWMIYAIRYGAVPRRYFDRIANYELRKMKQKVNRPRWQYYNVLYAYTKVS